MIDDDAVNANGWLAASTTADQVKSESERLLYALGRTNAQLFVGLAEVVGNAMLSVNESLWGRPLEMFADQDGSPIATTFLPMDRWDTGWGAGPGPGQVAADISGKILTAIGEATIVLGRSASIFSEAYGEKLRRDLRDQGGLVG